MDWLDDTGLLAADDPDEVDKTFDRAEPHVGVAVIGLALNHADADTVLACVNRALEAETPSCADRAWSPWATPPACTTASTSGPWPTSAAS